MDIYQLQTFCRVVQYKNFTLAAKDLAISQPAVSRQIESLEQSLGLKLFHRVGRSIEITDAGKTLYQMGEQIISLVNRAKSVMEGMKNLESGSLVVGASTTIGNYFIAPVVMKFLDKYSGIKVNLEIKSTEEIQDRIKRNTLDIAIIPEPDSAELITESFLQDELVLVVPSIHHLRYKENVTLKDLKNEKLIMRGIGSNTRKKVEEHFKKYGVDLPYYVELNSTESIKQALISGTGISFLSRRTIELELQNGVIDIIRGGDQLRVLRSFSIVYHKSTFLSPAVLAFISFLRNAIA